MRGKDEKKNTKEAVPLYIKWGWLGGGKDRRDDVLILTFVLTISGIV